jgi:glucose/arabinose dehydrogenase
MKGLLGVIVSTLTAALLLYTMVIASSVQATDNHKLSQNYSQGERKTESIHNEVVTGDSSSGINKKLLSSDTYSNPAFIFFDNKSQIVSIGLRSFWGYENLSCNPSFRCLSNSSTGWKSDKSFQVSTSNNTNTTWSWIRGMGIEVEPNQRYELITHMKLNKWATESHIVLEGFNETSKQWYQITQCPSGTVGPLEWHQFSCEVTIPEATSKIRPLLNAGWSTLENEEAVTFFDDVSMIQLTDGNSTTNVPTINNDPNLDIEVVAEGLENPTSMTFLGPDDILVLEKDKGTVRRIVNGTLLSKPILDVPVASRGERGLLGIAVTSHETGNPPANVLDNDLNTRWANNGVGSSIRADLGSVQNICSVDVAWAFGDEYQYHFVIATSTDGTTFTNKFSGDSSGTTLDSEKYIIPATDARYVRITVNGNTHPTFNTWAEITELDIFGSSSSPPSTQCTTNLPISAVTASASESDNRIYVFLYYTESATGRDGDDISTKKEPLGNRLYRYEYIDGKLINPKLLLDLPTLPGPIHNGGVLSIGHDNQSLYLVVGNLDGRTKTQNNMTGKAPDGTGGILRLTLDGEPMQGILGDAYPLNLYYAYGIRNSFGMDFDPITGKLWDTENGPSYADEINLVEPGFNSGWNVVQGNWKREGDPAGDIALNPEGLVDFGGKGKYSDPEYEWSEIVAPTALKFLNSDKLGKQYENDIFVGSYQKGHLYHFALNDERTKLILDTALEGRLSEKTIYAKGFGAVTDIEVGPDGYLYVVSISQGKVFRIVAK